MHPVSDYIGEEVCLDRNWRIEHQIGSGGFGLVYAARSDEDMAGVVKFIPKAPGAERELLFEDLDGVPNVIPILDKGETSDCWLLVMPEAEQSLRDHLIASDGRIEPVEAVTILVDITTALVEIEDRVVHRDIKPENVLFHDGRWCLADFGISRYADATTAPDTKKYAKTSAYAAPEQWNGDRASSSTDVYALGVVAYELLAGRRPFVGPAEHDYRRQHLNELPDSIPGIPTQLRSLIDECLYKSPEARPRPRNLLARWPRSVQPTSGVGSLLQEINAQVVQQEAEESRRRTAARIEAEHRLELYDVAQRSLAPIIDLLHDQLLQNAPNTKLSDKGGTLNWSLASGQLSVARPKLASNDSPGNSSRRSIDTVAYAQISVRMPRNPSGYEGRSHSLWYCDPQNKGHFRWYDKSFWSLFKDLQSVHLR
ncbi:MAG: serine/threonine-protein kinase [Chloroflexota bacterium]|nr:serine/threonine-protein kinase [Chloroflexota bacterium]